MRSVLSFLSFFLFVQICSSTVHAEENWQRVYLATFPRSGNHWLRYLLEEATHVATGSVYCDRQPLHLKTPFPWGGYAAKNGYVGNCRYPELGEIVVIKTHYPSKPKTEFDLLPSVKIIRIVRHPMDSFYSHFLFAGKKLPEDGKIPDEYVKDQVPQWKKFEEYWNRQANVLTIRYEDLFENPRQYLKKITESIGYDLSDLDIERAITLFPPSGGIYKHLDDYQLESKNFISQELGELMKNYGYRVK